MREIKNEVMNSVTGFWNPNNPISVPNSVTVGTQFPPVDPQVRIANALERIAFALEAENARRAVTVITTVKKPPAIRKSKKRRA